MKNNIITRIIFTGLLAISSISLLSAQTATDGSGEADTCLILRSSVLRFSSSDKETNGEVSKLQDFLSYKGYYSGQVTGFYGIKTVKSVQKYQQTKNIPQVGRVGGLTRSLIEKETCGTTSVSSSGNSSSQTTSNQGSQSATVCAYEGVVFGGSPPCTAAIEGVNNGSRCTCTKSGAQSTNQTTKTSLARVSVANSLSGPWLDSGSAICNVGNVYIQAASLIKSAGPKGCIAPAGATCTPRDFYNDEWRSDSNIIATISPGEFPNGSYDTYLSYPGETISKVGSITLKSCASTKVCAYEGVVFGGSPPCTAAIEGVNNGSRCTCSFSQ